MTSDDALLLKRWIGERDGEAFNELVSRHAALVYSVTRRVLRQSADAEDAAQDCFLKLARSRAAPESSFASWLHSMALHVAIDHHRREARRRAVEERFAIQAPVEERQDWSEVEPCVDEAIEALPLDVRDVIIAHFIERQTHAEIARRLGMTRQGVSYRIRRGIERVRDAVARKVARQISIATLASLLGSRMAEAAPASLLASLGKVSLAGVPTVTTSISTGAKVGGLLFMTKKVSFAAALVVLLLSLSYVVVTRSRTAREAPVERERGTRSAVDEIGRQAGAKPRPESLPARSDGGDPARFRSIVGLVRDAETAEPVAGARLGVLTVEVVTDAGGAYRIDGIEGDVAAVTLSAEGYVALGRDIAIDGAAPEARQDFDIDRQLTILCVDGEGAPVAGAEVYFAQPVAGDPSGEKETYGPLVTDEAGLVRLAEVPHYARDAITHRAIYATLPGEMAGLFTEHYRIEASPRPFPLRVVLRRTVEVAGIVDVPDGYDARDATVRLAHLGWRERTGRIHGLARYRASERRAWQTLFEVHPDADGHFRMAGIPDGGGVDLVAEAPGLAPQGFASGNPLELRQIVFDLAPESVIEGTLRYADTELPAEGVTLVASRHDFGLNDLGDVVSQVGEEGRFEFRGLSSSPFVVALADSFDRGEWTMAPHGPIRVRSGRTARLDLFLERGVRVSGRAAEAPTGEPIAGVEIVAESAPLRIRLASAITDDDGFYAFRVPPGHCTVAARTIPDGYEASREARSVRLAIASDQPAQENVDFALTPHGDEERPADIAVSAVRDDVEYTSVRGWVVDENGLPLPGILITVYEMPGRSSSTSGTYTDENGLYERSVPRGGSYRVRASGRQFSWAWSAEFQAVSEEAHEVEVIVLRAATSTVEGVALDPEGRPLEGLVLSASSRNKGDLWVFNRKPTDASGRFRFENLLSDEIVRITVQSFDYELGEFLVAPGSSDLRLVFHQVRDRPSPGKRVKEASTMVGHPAPDWEVREWIQEPAVQTPSTGSGRETILVYTWLPDEWSKLRELFSRVEELERTCRRSEAVPVLILAHTAHSSLVRPEIERRGLKLGVGIDRLVPQSEYMDSNNATMIAYGRGEWPLIVVIDAGGVIREVRSGLERIESLLTR